MSSTSEGSRRFVVRFSFIKEKWMQQKYVCFVLPFYFPSIHHSRVRITIIVCRSCEKRNENVHVLYFIYIYICHMYVCRSVFLCVCVLHKTPFSNDWASAAWIPCICTVCYAWYIWSNDCISCGKKWKNWLTQAYQCNN